MRRWRWAEGPYSAKRACLPQGLEEGARSAPQLLVDYNYRVSKKCLNVKQKLGTRKNLKKTHSLTLSLFSPLFQGTKYISLDPHRAAASCWKVSSLTQSKINLVQGKLQVASCKLQVASCKLQVARCQADMTHIALIAAFSLYGF